MVPAVGTSSLLYEAVRVRRGVVRAADAARNGAPVAPVPPVNRRAAEGKAAAREARTEATAGPDPSALEVNLLRRSGSNVAALLRLAEGAAGHAGGEAPAGAADGLVASGTEQSGGSAGASETAGASNGQGRGEGTATEGVHGTDGAEGKVSGGGASEGREVGGGRELSEEEQREVAELKRRDAEVRRHEQAHKAAAGDLAKGPPQFEYETGPDGRGYAVSGEVAIDTSPVPGDPAATIAKMERVRRAALAPAQPSAQDRQVAAQAAREASRARAELARARRSEGDAGAAATGRHIDITV